MDCHCIGMRSVRGGLDDPTIQILTVLIAPGLRGIIWRCGQSVDLSRKIPAAVKVYGRTLTTIVVVDYPVSAVWPTNSPRRHEYICRKLGILLEHHESAEGGDLSLKSSHWVFSCLLMFLTRTADTLLGLVEMSSEVSGRNSHADLDGVATG